VAVSLAVCDIFNVKEWLYLEHLVRVCSRSLKMVPFAYAIFLVSHCKHILYTFELFGVE